MSSVVALNIRRVNRRGGLVRGIHYRELQRGIFIRPDVPAGAVKPVGTGGIVLSLSAVKGSTDLRDTASLLCSPWQSEHHRLRDAAGVENRDGHIRGQTCRVSDGHRRLPR